MYNVRVEKTYGNLAYQAGLATNLPPNLLRQRTSGFFQWGGGAGGGGRGPRIIYLKFEIFSTLVYHIICNEDITISNDLLPL
jgi:hypothetical protein